MREAGLAAGESGQSTRNIGRRVSLVQCSRDVSGAITMSTKAEIIASVEAARVELDQALAHLAELPALDWETVRCSAHTLGNYLNITNACVQLLQMSLADYPDQEVQVWLKGLERVTDLMIFVSRQLTNASAATDVPLMPERVNLALLVRRTAVFYESVANQKRLQIHSEIPEVAEVRGDRIALAAVMDNLLSNAIKYSPVGKEISLRVTIDSGNVVCTVADQGPGLSSADQARLFQRGVRLSSVPTGGETSTGFGLFIARRLIERMGGSIWCETAAGQGCRFSFRLPLLPEESHALAGPQSNQRSG
jgi:two-component system, sensor histidine kinase LadS